MTTYQIVVKARGPTGPIGPPGPAGNAVVASFGFGDATPASVASLTAGQAIIAITVVILEPFDGVGSGIEVGVLGDPGRYMPASGNNPAAAGTYAAHPGVRLNADTEVLVSITPGAGATAGSGIVTISLQ